jgi:hypothetical protein
MSSLPSAIVAVMCDVLEDDERLAKAGVSCDARTERLVRARAVLRAWTEGLMTSEEAETQLRALLP